MDRKKMGLSQSTDLDLLIYKENEQENHGLEPKYRFAKKTKKNKKLSEP